MRVLVVEDDPVLNRLLTRQLAKAGDLGFSCYVHPEIEFFLLEPGPYDGSVPVPAQLFSHSDQQVLWQTPSAVTSKPRPRARLTISLAILAWRSWCRSSTKERSIFSRLIGNCARRLREEWPVPKSSITRSTPRSVSACRCGRWWRAVASMRKPQVSKSPQ